MAWTTPRVWATSEVVTAANMNTYLSNNLSFLGGTAAAAVGTGQNTASTTYTDLATSGPAVTVTTQTTAVLDLSCAMTNAGSCTYAFMAVAVSGATTIAAADANGILQNVGVVGAALADQGGGPVYITGLTPGSNTFTAKYRVAAGTGTFGGRIIKATPLTT